MVDERLTRRLTRLRDIELFSDVGATDLVRLVDSFVAKRFERDEIIMRQGDDSREVFVILSGLVRIYRTSPSGDETTIAIFGENDLIGEFAALDNQPRSATAKAIGEVMLLAMPHERFVQYAKTVPGFAFGLARLLSQKVRWTASYAESIAQFDAAGRLLHILLAHNERYGQAIEPGKRYIIELGLNQSDLASMVGARREWVNRILRDWKRRELVTFERGTISILDLPSVIAERDSRIEAFVNNDEW